MAETPASEPQTPPLKKKSNKTLLIVIVVILMVLAAGGFALKKAQEKISQIAGEKIAETMMEKAAGGTADVDISGDGLTVKTKDGTFTAGTSLPSDFPSDIPIYPGSDVAYSGTNTSQDGGGAGVMLTTADEASKIIAYYKKELASAGWTVEDTQNVAGTTAMTAAKGNRNLYLGVTGSDDGTTITIGQSTEDN